MKWKDLKEKVDAEIKRQGYKPEDVEIDYIDVTDGYSLDVLVLKISKDSTHHLQVS